MMNVNEIELATTNHISLPQSSSLDEEDGYDHNDRHRVSRTNEFEMDGLMVNGRHFRTVESGGCYCSRRVIVFVALCWIFSTIGITYSYCNIVQQEGQAGVALTTDDDGKSSPLTRPPASAPSLSNNADTSTGPPSSSATSDFESDTTNNDDNNETNGSNGKISCSNCCRGTDACKFNLGTIDDDSCNGDGSCQYNTGHIHKGSCNSDGGSCNTNSGHIKENSCNERYTCTDNTSTINSNSCLSLYACRKNNGMIGSNSCLTGHYACDSNGSNIGDGSCSGGLYACANNNKQIGDRSCNIDIDIHEDWHYVCSYVKTNIPNDFIPTLPPSTGVKIQTDKNVKCINCCLGKDSCEGNSGDIGNNSCNGKAACFGNKGTIGHDSCSKENSCLGNVGIVGDNSCNKSNDVCLYNTGTIHDNSCQAAEESHGGHDNNICNGNKVDIPSNTCNILPFDNPICSNGG